LQTLDPRAFFSIREGNFKFILKGQGISTHRLDLFDLLSDNNHLSSLHVTHCHTEENHNTKLFGNLFMTGSLLQNQNKDQLF